MTPVLTERVQRTSTDPPESFGVSVAVKPVGGSGALAGRGANAIGWVFSATPGGYWGDGVNPKANQNGAVRGTS